MRRSRIVAAAVAAVPLALSVAFGPPAVAGDAPAAPAARPAIWTNVTTPPMSGDTSQKVYRQVAVVPGGAAFAAGYTRHNLPGASEVRALVEQWDGSGWQTKNTPDVETAPAADYMSGIAGTSADDVWVVGQSATAPGRQTSRPFALHYDGSTWTKVAVPDPSGGTGAGMNAVVAISPDDVWAVGTAYPLNAKGAAYHWDGSAWSAYRIPRIAGCRTTNYTELTAITATPAGDVYAGGDCPTDSGYAGFIVRMQSLTQWQVVTRLEGTSAIADLTSDAAGTVWATGNGPTRTGSRPFLLYGSGSTWTRQLRPAPPAGTSEWASGVAVTPTGVTIVGEANVGNQRRPFAATLLAANRWQAVIIRAPASASWMAAIDGSATGPVMAMGQYLDARADIVGFASYP